MSFTSKIFFKLGYDFKKRDTIKEQKDKFGNYLNSFFIQKSLLKSPTPIIFDVGAYDGRTTTQYLSLFPLAKVYAFEPFSDSFEKLKFFASTNNNIFPYNFAVSNQNGQSLFYCNDFDATNSLLESNENIEGLQIPLKHKKSIKVNTITIDSFTTDKEIHFIDILKLDIQGGELEALKGAENLLKAQKINLIYTEIEFVQLYKNQPLYDDINNYLKGFGYELFGYYNFNFSKKGQLSWGDAIYCSANFLKSIE
jgi:FkbM family methyltransferase